MAPKQASWRNTKQYRCNGREKNSISLFGLEIGDGQLQAQHTYDWDTFEEQVLGQK
jgi:CRISPR-associated protein Csm1